MLKLGPNGNNSPDVRLWIAAMGIPSKSSHHYLFGVRIVVEKNDSTGKIEMKLTRHLGDRIQVEEVTVYDPDRPEVWRERFYRYHLWLWGKDGRLG